MLRDTWHKLTLFMTRCVGFGLIEVVPWVCVCVCVVCVYVCACGMTYCVCVCVCVCAGVCLWSNALCMVECNCTLKKAAACSQNVSNDSMSRCWGWKRTNFSYMSPNSHPSLSLQEMCNTLCAILLEFILALCMQFVGWAMPIYKPAMFSFLQILYNIIAYLALVYQGLQRYQELIIYLYYTMI